jgi:uncharacterized membrane protein YkvA (DUF1232 family)
MKNLWALWKRLITRDWLALFFALRDERVSLPAKVVTILTAAYAISPLDLIPDTIPLLGWLDDAVIVTSGIILAEQFIAPHIMEEHRTHSATYRRIFKYILGGLVIFWIALILLLLWWIRAH